MYHEKFLKLLYDITTKIDNKHDNDNQLLFPSFTQ